MNPPKVDTPSLHRVPLRALARLLAVLLVPLVVIATPGVGNAATKVSGSTLVSFKGDTWVPTEWISCKLQVFYSVSGSDGLYSQSIKTNSGDCTTGPLFNMEGEGGSFMWNGQRPSGGACSASTSFTLGTDEALPNTVASATLMPTAPENLCTITELCWSVGDVRWGRDMVFTGCEPVEMGVPQLPAGSAGGDCPMADISGVMAVGEVVDGYWRVRWSVNGVWKGGATYESTRHGQPPKMMATVYYTQPGSPPMDPLALNVDVTNGLGVTRYVGQGSPTVAYEVVGVQLWDGWQYTQGSNAAPLNKLPQEDPAGIRATTKTSDCLFWFGRKMAEDPNSDRDIPAGGLDGALPSDVDPAPVAVVPETKEEPCTFSYSDPTTWLEGGMCAAVGLLGQIWKTLSGIPGLILDGLQGLFVPPDGYLDARTTATRDKINDTTPAKYLDAFDGLASGQVSGCGGIPFNFSMRGETYVQEHIGAACSGNMAQVASLVRIAISAMVVIGGGLACIRALGSGFGWNPNVGSPGGAA